MSSSSSDIIIKRRKQSSRTLVVSSSSEKGSDESSDNNSTEDECDLEKDLSSNLSDFIVSDDEDEETNHSVDWRKEMPTKFTSTVSIEVHFHRFLRSLLADLLDWERYHLFLEKSFTKKVFGEMSE